MGKKLNSELFKGPLTHIDHDAVIGKGQPHTHEVHASQTNERCGQRSEIRISGSSQGDNIIINQGLHKQGSFDCDQSRAKNT